MSVLETSGCGDFSWEAELERLGAGESGWALLRCLAPMVLARTLSSDDDGNRPSWEGACRMLGEADSLEAFSSEVSAALEARGLSSQLSDGLADALELWASQRGPLPLDEAGLDEGVESGAFEPTEGARAAELVQAARELASLVSSLPLNEKGCFDAVARACLKLAGKTGGLFSTPGCVCELVARLASADMRKASSLYDPCAGAGFLLDACASYAAEGAPLSLFAQDVDAEAHALLRARSASRAARGEGRPVDARCGDVLEGSWHEGEAPFDVIVSHAPTLLTWAAGANEGLTADPRFACAGELAPRDSADLAFVLHSYHCLAEGGVAALVVYPAPLRRGGAERAIRRFLIEQNAVDAVIQLPAGLLQDSRMAANVLVLRKGRAGRDVLFVNAMRECVSTGASSVLSREGIERIACAVERREDAEGFCRRVEPGELVRKAWSLTVADYFKGETPALSVDPAFLKRTTDDLSDLFAVSRRRIDGIIR